MAYLGKETKKKNVDMCICITDSLCCTSEANTTLYIKHAPIKVLKYIYIYIYIFYYHSLKQERGSMPPYGTSHLCIIFTQLVCEDDKLKKESI